MSILDKARELLQHFEELKTRLIRVGIVAMSVFVYMWMPTKPLQLAALSAICVACGAAILVLSVLRERRIKYALATYLILLSVPFLYSPSALLYSEYTPLVAVLFRYLTSTLPKNVKVATLGLLTPLELSMWISLACAVAATLPYAVYELYMFASPGLYPHEKRIVKRYLVLSIALFYIGMAVGYVLIYRTLIRLFLFLCMVFGLERLLLARILIKEVVSAMVFTGAIFETPVIMCLLSHIGIVDPERYCRYRVPIYAVAMIIIAILNPDPTLASTIMWILMFIALYEAGIVLAKRAYSHRTRG